MPSPNPSLLAELPGPLAPDQEALYRAAWPSADLLAGTVPIDPTSRVLLLGSAADPFALVAAHRAGAGQCIVADDDAAACDTLLAAAAAAGLASVSAADPATLAAAPPTGLFDVAAGNTLYHPNKQMTAALVRLAHALLAPGSTLYLTGATNRGIRSIADDVRAVFGAVTVAALRKGHRVLAATRGPEPPLSAAALAVAISPPDASAQPETVTLQGHALTLLPAPLVFAAGRLDPATALLANALELRPEDRFADLGCGSGVLGLLAARLAPGAPVYLLDASRAAIRLAEANAQMNGITGVTFLAGDAIALLRQHALHPTVIATNPPFHVGQMQTNQIARRFIAGAAASLAPGGRFYLVANRFLSYEGELRARFGEVREVAGDARYKVLLAVAPLDSART